MLESNYLTILITPAYEKPVDTPEDIIERGLTILYNPGGESMKNAMAGIETSLPLLMLLKYFFQDLITSSIET